MNFSIDIDGLRARVRERRGSYAQLARMSGVSESYLSKFGRGAYQSPRILTLQRLSEALSEMEQKNGAGC
jgi:predicted transcriptional regulator